jgi:hypothetical protein
MALHRNICRPREHVHKSNSLLSTATATAQQAPHVSTTYLPAHAAQHLVTVIMPHARPNMHAPLHMQAYPEALPRPEARLAACYQ